LIGLALLGEPLFIVISALALLLFYFAEIDSMVVIIELYRLASQPILLAIPLFTFTGYLLAESKAPERIVNLSRALIGWLPGGLAIVALISCAIFTAFTGASGVTIIALGGLLLPVLIKDNYPETFSLGLLTSSGNLGLLFPPSLPIILYGLVANTSIDQLWTGGILPGTLMILLIALYSLFYIKRKKLNIQQEKVSFQTVWQSVKKAGWEIPLPIIILWGIYTGKFTPTEAASISAFYVFIVEILIHKDLSFTKDMPIVIRKSMVLVGGILMILAASLGLANYMIDAEIPTKILSYMQSFITSKLGFLIVLNIFLLIIGALMDIFSAIMVIVPIIIPIANSFGVDPVHLGIIFLTNLGIGYSTPPVGMNLFIASFRFERPVIKLYKATLPFLAILLIALAIITYLPELTLIFVQ
jgi:tripartite ATP-independent transporter DctM subunit